MKLSTSASPTPGRGVGEAALLDPVAERLEQLARLLRRRDDDRIDLDPGAPRWSRARTAAGPGPPRAPRRRGARAAGRRRGRRPPGPWTASSSAAMSRTDRASASSTVIPDIASPINGPSEIRWRLGFSPTRPQWLAGIRIDPPPSLAWAIATMPGGDRRGGAAARAARGARLVPRVGAPRRRRGTRWPAGSRARARWSCRSSRTRRRESARRGRCRPGRGSRPPSAPSSRGETAGRRAPRRCP